MGTTSPHQFQNFPNPNPKFDQYSLHTNRHHLNDLMHFHDISSYLMSDVGLGLEERVELQDKGGVLSKNSANDLPTGSSLSDPLDCNIKYKKDLQEHTVQQKIRFAFRTKSMLDIMDDGFKWRKYGKKMVKSSPNPRNYFKCKIKGCDVKKRVERDGEDSSYVITTYEGVHNHHSPSSIIYCSPQSSNL